MRGARREEKRKGDGKRREKGEWKRGETKWTGGTGWAEKGNDKRGRNKKNNELKERNLEKGWKGEIQKKGEDNCKKGKQESINNKREEGKKETQGNKRGRGRN